MNTPRCKVERSKEEVICHQLGSRSRRHVVFTRYRESFVQELGAEPYFYYEDTLDLLERAKICAGLILTNQCQNFVAAEHASGGPVRVVPREHFEAHQSKYTQLLAG